MSGLDDFFALYASLSTVFGLSAFLAGEARPDAYVALNVLSFYISYSLARPRLSRKIAYMIHAAMLAVFSAAVSVRIYEVLAG